MGEGKALVLYFSQSRTYVSTLKRTPSELMTQESQILSQ